MIKRIPEHYRFLRLFSVCQVCSARLPFGSYCPHHMPASPEPADPALASDLIDRVTTNAENAPNAQKHP